MVSTLRPDVVGHSLQCIGKGGFHLFGIDRFVENAGQGGLYIGGGFPENCMGIIADDPGNDGCEDDFLLLCNVPSTGMDQVDWYKLDPNGLGYQGTLLQSETRENQILAMSSGDFDGDIYLDFLIVEKAAHQNPVLSYYEFEPGSSGQFDLNADSDSPLLMFRNEVAVDAPGDREFVSVAIGDFNDLDSIEVLTIEYTPIDERMHVVHYFYDPNESRLEFQSELLSIEKWSNNLRGITVGRFAPNERPGLIL